MEPGQAARPGQAGPQGPTLTKLQTVSAANQATKHIGAEGSEFVANILRSVNPPQEALKRVQETCGLSNPLCKPLLTMLDYLEVQRRDAHQHILNRCGLPLSTENSSGSSRAGCWWPASEHQGDMWKDAE